MKTLLDCPVPLQVRRRCRVVNQQRMRLRPHWRVFFSLEYFRKKSINYKTILTITKIRGAYVDVVYIDPGFERIFCVCVKSCGDDHTVKKQQKKPWRNGTGLVYLGPVMNVPSGLSGSSCVTHLKCYDSVLLQTCNPYKQAERDEKKRQTIVSEAQPL